MFTLTEILDWMWQQEMKTYNVEAKPIEDLVNEIIESTEDF